MSTQVLSSSGICLPSGGVCSYNSVRPRILPAVGCLSRVKRCLFVDNRSEEEREDALQQAKQELDRLSRHDSLRWNFNFIQEKPIQGGRFDWTTTSPSSQLDDDATKPSSPQTNVVLRQSQITGKEKKKIYSEL